MTYSTVKHELYPDSADTEDFSYARVERFARLVAGDKAREFSGKQGVVEEFSNRVEPHSPGLRDRLWYGAGSSKSAAWAGDRQIARAMAVAPTEVFNRLYCIIAPWFTATRDS